MRRLRLGGTFTLGLALFIVWAGRPVFSQPPPYDGIFDWPVGERTQVGGNYTIQQNYNNQDGPRLCNKPNDPDGTSGCNTDDDYVYTCGRGHAGIDITRTDGAGLAANQTVYAAADGIVQCVENPSYPGRVIVIRHPMPDGSVVYTQYGHLASTSVARNAIVRRGTPIGTIYDWGTNSHLHFEVRKFPYWDRSDAQDEKPSFVEQGNDCWGRGYAAPLPAGVALHPDYLDPIAFILQHRAFPATVTRTVAQPLLTEPGPAGNPVSGTPEIPASRPFTILKVLRDRQFQCGLTFAAANSGCQGGTHCRQDRVGLCTGNSSEECVNGACDWWYEVSYTPTGSSTAVRGFVRVFDKDPYTSILSVGEASQIPAAPWSDPGSPLVHYEFDINDVSNRVVANRAGDATLAGRIVGTYQLIVPPNDSGIQLDGATAYLEASNSGRIQADARFSVEAKVRRRSDTSEDVVAGQWHPTDPSRQRWLLTYLPESPGQGRYNNEVTFKIRTVSGRELSVSYALADCDDINAWSWVGATYDPADGLRLYWNRRLAAFIPLGTERIAAGNVSLRVGSHGTDAANDLSRFDGDIDRFRLWAPAPPACTNFDLAFVVDATGSMNDDIAAVRTAASDIVDRILSGPTCARVAVTDYKDHPVAPYGSPGDYPYRVVLDFTNDRGAILAAIRSLGAAGGGDFPESVYSGLINTINAAADGRGGDLSPWRSNAAKSMLLFGDAPAHDPEPITGYTLGSVVNAALAGGVIVVPQASQRPGLRRITGGAVTSPIEISAIHIGSDPSARSNFQALSGQTGGAYLNPASATQVVDAVIDAIEEALNRLPVGNPDFETQTTSQHGRIDGWGPAGAWDLHSRTPAGNNADLGARYGYYAAGTAETVGQVLSVRFAPGTVYTFRSRALGGNDRTGRIPYQIGYAATDGNLSTFVALKTQVIDVTGDADWVATSGVSHTTGASGPEIGRQIIVRFGNGSAGGFSDIWFDDVEVVTGETPSNPPVGPLLINGDLEKVTTPQFNFINGWAPNGGWSFHSQFPAGNNATLGTRFGFYAAGTAETVGQIIPTRFVAGKTYTFKSWAIGGGDRLGKLPYQIGYAAVDGDLGSFTPLATRVINLDGLTSWTQTIGVVYTTVPSSPALGKQIIVRLGNSAAGGVSDIWFDKLELTSN